MKRILTALAALALVAATAVPAMAGMLDDIRSRNVVRIGVSLGGEPIGFRDAQNNPVGYDVDVATLLAAKLGVPVEFTDVSGDARISMLVSGQLDIVVANTSATLERAKSVNFTIPYNRAGLRVIVQADCGHHRPRRPCRQEDRGRPRHHRRNLHQDCRAGSPSWSMSTSSRPMACCSCSRSASTPRSRIPRCSTISPRKNPTLVTLAGLYSNDPIGIAVAKGDPEFVRWLDMFVSDYIQSGAYEANYKKWWGETANPPTLNPIW